MRIITDSELFTSEQIAKIEDMKNAVYVCETCLRSKGGGWINEPVAVFWNKDPANIPAGGSAWFGMFFRYGSYEEMMDPQAKPRLYITNAVSAVEFPIQGIVAKNGDVIYSRYRHDYRGSPDGSVWIDGGRDYTRTGGAPYGMVTLQIIDGELKIVDDNGKPVEGV